MEKKIDALIAMQKIDDKIVTKNHLKKELPRRLKELKDSVVSSKENLDRIKKELETNIVQQNLHEKEIKANLDKMAKYENQLLNIKTNKEYKALNNEISALKNKNNEIDEKIIAAIEKETELNKEIKIAESDYEKAKNALNEEEEDIKKEIGQVEKDIVALKSQRSEIAIKNLPKSLIKRYGLLITNKGGKAVAFVEKNSCSACGVKLRPQIIIEIKKRGKIINCENCGRLLVHKKEEK